MSKKTIFQKALWFVGGIVAWIVLSYLTDGNLNAGLALIIGLLGVLTWDENSWENLFGTKVQTNVAKVVNNDPAQPKKPNKRDRARLKKGVQRKR